MQIPWKLKSTTFYLAARTSPSVLYFAQKHITGRSKRKIAGIRDSWAFHYRHIKERGAQRVIEFGGGKDLAQNLYLSTLGIDQTVVDLNPMLDLELVNRAIEQLAGLGHSMNGPVESLTEIEQQYRIAYIAPMDMSATPFSAGSFDACISSNTLEHIPRDTIAAIWQETRRLLAPSGFVSASIDYSDHYAHTDRTIPMLHFLRYTRKEWQRYNHPNHFQNRLRHRHHIDLLTDAGFRIEKEACASPEKLDGISIPPENMTGSETDLARWGRILAVL